MQLDAHGSNGLRLVTLIQPISPLKVDITRIFPFSRPSTASTSNGLPGNMSVKTIDTFDLQGGVLQSSGSRIKPRIRASTKSPTLGEPSDPRAAELFARFVDDVRDILRDVTPQVVSVRRIDVLRELFADVLQDVF